MRKKPDECPAFLLSISLHNIIIVNYMARINQMLKGRGGDEIPFRQRTRSRERKLPPRRGAGAAV